MKLVRKVWFLYLPDTCHKNSEFSNAVSASKVIVHACTSNAYPVQGGTGGKSFTSVMICPSTAGHLIQSFVIYRSKRLYEEWCLSGPSGAGYATSDK